MSTAPVALAHTADGVTLDLGRAPAPPLSENRAGGHWAKRARA